MKKILTTILLVLAAAATVMAIPARPGKRIYRQPDGTTITLQQHGDEYFHWITDQNGRIVEKGSDGYYRQVSRAVHEARRMKAAAAPKKKWVSNEEARETNFGDRKVLCIIANFTDSTFVIDNPNQAFSDMLNKEGYNDNGAIGSVRDFYIDNSNNQYRPQFDVFGPVTLTQSSKYYDDNGVYLAILEAYELMSGQINIDDYDTDNDGAVDMILFYYPGHNEAENAGEESIWPHQSSGYFGTIGGKAFVRYFCTSELKGNRGTKMCGIGTTCHEFAHSLGVPDFYDTDYDDNGSNNFTTNQFDLMALGGYNDDGRRPPYFSAIERNILGWMEAPQELDNGSYTLEPVRNNKAYTSASTTGGEYFVFETRDNYKWDSALGQFGMLVYHVDQSSNIVADGLSASYLWNYTNSFNAYGGHPCCYIIPSGDKDRYVFNGSGGTNKLTLTGWDGEQTGVLLTNIAFDGSSTSFTSSVSYSRQIVGYVYASNGDPVEGAQLSLSQSAYLFAPAKAPALLSTDTVVYSDANGYYSFTLPDSASDYQIVTVRKDGYQPVSRNVYIESRFTILDVSLMELGEGEKLGLMHYDPDGDIYYCVFTDSAFAVGSHYTAEELASRQAVGATIESVSFYIQPEKFDNIYVLVDINGKRVLKKDVTDQLSLDSYTTVDISDAGITIPANSVVNIGCGVSGNTKCSVFISPSLAENNDGSWMSTDFLGSNSTWFSVGWYGGSYLSFMITARLRTSIVPELNHYGIAFIKLSDKVPAVVAPSSKTVYAVEWYLDGVSVESPVAIDTLPSGIHTYLAVISYYDGTEERVYYDFKN